MPLIYLSPSNQTWNRYAFGNTNESEQMRKVAEVVNQELQRYQCDVVVASQALGIEERGAEANRMGADVYLAIHSNAGGGHGTEAFYAPDKAGSKEFAQSVYDTVAALTPSPDRGLKNGMAAFNGVGYAEIRVPQRCPCLLEVEFHDREDLARWITENIVNLGQAIATGIVNYLHLTPKEPPVPMPDPQAAEFYRVFVQYGAFTDKANALAAQANIRKLGYNTMILFGG